MKWFLKQNDFLKMFLSFLLDIKKIHQNRCNKKKSFYCCKRKKMYYVFNLTDMNYAAVEYDLFIWFE
jgi:hypothetical protein